MNILSIETSADETGVSIVEALGDFPSAKYAVLGNALRSQIENHREYGGIFPSLAKREHAGALIPLLKKALEEASLPTTPRAQIFPEQKMKTEKLLEREPGLAETLLDFYSEYETPAVSMIAVTAGPGLEPALWVGVNFAKALASLWNVPVVAVNHMEGHVLSSLFDGTHLAEIQFPSLALLISGGHTELIEMDSWQKYQRIGQTRDDAVGEAFDKVARLLGLPYPGGPEISRLAASARNKQLSEFAALPRPMLKSDDFDFSFSGLKTAVRYAIADKDLSESDKEAVARDFEDAAAEVLLKKTVRAVEQCGIKTVILGGGVSANRYIRDTFIEFLTNNYPDVALHIPEPKLSTDNSVMIALAGHARAKEAWTPEEAQKNIIAKGNRSLTEEN